MKIVVEVTATGVNVYTDQSAEVQVFDVREMKQDQDEERERVYSTPEAVTKIHENFYKGLTHQTLGLFQVY